jgi:hypothetical protein
MVEEKTSEKVLEPDRTPMLARILRDQTPVAVARLVFTTEQASSRHTKANINLITRFLNVRVAMEEVARDAWRIDIRG